MLDRKAVHARKHAEQKRRGWDGSTDWRREGCTGEDGNASQLLNNTRLLLPVHTVGAQCVRIGDGRSNGRQR